MGVNTGFVCLGVCLEAADRITVEKVIGDTPLSRRVANVGALERGCIVVQPV